jgi:hypothetical protein
MLQNWTEDSGEQAFEGEGDAFQWQSRERPVTETLVSAHKAKVQCQRARMTLSGESPHNYCRIGSSGSNLAYEGLLLGMQAEDHGDPPN